MTDFRVLLPDELEAIARRVAREPVYSSDTDCRQAFADRRHLIGHIIATTAFDANRALGEDAMTFAKVREAITFANSCRRWHIATTAFDANRALGASRAQAELDRAERGPGPDVRQWAARLVAERQDHAAESPDDSPPPPAPGL